MAYQPVSSAARQAWIDGEDDAEVLRQIDAEHDAHHPQVGDKVITWDCEDLKTVRGTVSKIADDGLVFVRCVDGIEAEYPPDGLVWKFGQWNDTDIPD